MCTRTCPRLFVCTCACVCVCAREHMCIHATHICCVCMCVRICTSSETECEAACVVAVFLWSQDPHAILNTSTHVDTHVHPDTLIHPDTHIDPYAPIKNIHPCTHSQIHTFTRSHIHIDRLVRPRRSMYIQVCKEISLGRNILQTKRFHVCDTHVTDQ